MKGTILPMKTKMIFAAASLLAALLPTGAFAQDGSDINKAIPIVFGQTISDIGDSSLVPNKVYKISLAKGQQFNVVADAKSNPYLYLAVLSPSALSLSSLKNSEIVAQAGSTNFRS